MSTIDTIGLDGEQRSDPEMRALFLRVFTLARPCMNDDGGWLSSLHEVQVYEALANEFPELTEFRRFAVLANVASVRASGREPTP